MPCDGVVVASTRVQCGLEDLIRTPEGFKTAAILLKKQGIDLRVVATYGGYASIHVDNNSVIVTPTEISGKNVPQKTLEALRGVFEQVAGVLNQQKVVEAIKRSATVLSTKETSQGYVVMSVRI